ncbi:hypothetical protein SAMN05421720_10851 [Rhodospira trueperi]|uniref:Uncharacterized protein n=1 Tax=Rhodospira trueperi TaxID=69960 RepID=A0A1G7DVN6_9PROT|nr:hypothetical protein SAMN05421720_10851 [Rhodospira trueperi]
MGTRLRSPMVDHSVGYRPRPAHCDGANFPTLPDLDRVEYLSRPYGIGISPPSSTRYVGGIRESKRQTPSPRIS